MARIDVVDGGEQIPTDVVPGGNGREVFAGLHFVPLGQRIVHALERREDQHLVDVRHRLAGRVFVGVAEFAGEQCAIEDVAGTDQITGVLLSLGVGERRGGEDDGGGGGGRGGDSGWGGGNPAALRRRGAVLADQSNRRRRLSRAANRCRRVRDKQRLQIGQRRLRRRLGGGSGFSFITGGGSPSPLPHNARPTRARPRPSTDVPASCIAKRANPGRE